MFVEGLERAAEVLTGEDVSEVAIEAVLAAADEVRCELYPSQPRMLVTFGGILPSVNINTVIYLS